MKNFLILFSVCFVIAVTAGCGDYVSVKNGNNIYYGTYYPKDFIHYDIKLIEKNSNVHCEGMLFLNSPSRSITFKNDIVDAKFVAACTDKKLLSADLKTTKKTFDNPYGTAYDQYNNQYFFSEVTEKEVKQNLSKSQIKQLKEYSNSLLKY